MPKVIDHEERRLHVASALLRITEREGMEAVSVRTVAAEAGCSIGAVQRYFRTKDEMLRFALRVVIDRAYDRIGAVRIGPRKLTFAEGLRATLLELLPFDATRRAEARIWVAFYARAVVEPSLAEMLRDLDRQANDHLRTALAYAESAGAIAAGQNHDALARLIIGIIDGLMWSALIHESRTPESIEAAVDAAVGLIAPGEERHEST